MTAGAGRLALVTGAAGFLGSHLVDALAAEGWTVRGLDDLSTGRAGNLDAAGDACTLHRGDVRDAGLLARLCDGVDAVFHLAARTGVKASLDDPVGSHAVDAAGSLAVLEAVRAAGVRRVVLASSWLVYGPEASAPRVETLPPAPASPYAVHKLCAEVYGVLYHRLHGLETVSLRYFPAFGPRQRRDGDYAADALDRARARAGRGRAGADSAARDAGGWLFVEDAVRATVLAADAERAVGQVVNVGGAPEADGSRAKAWLGFEPRTTIDQGLDRTADWLAGQERKA